MTIRWNHDLHESEKRCHKCGDYWPIAPEFWFFQNGQACSPCKGCQQDNRYATNAATPCCVPGCTAPRMVTKSGVYRYSRCEAHQRAYYRQTQNRKRLTA